MLLKLLNRLQEQETEGRFSYSAVIVDNDKAMSAEQTVASFMSGSSFPVKYTCEPEQNIALARNRAVENAGGDFVAFIDDDEFPASTWLLELFKSCNGYRVDGVLGPVMPHFEENPPDWIIKAKIVDRPNYPTGTVMHWDHMRTGNVLMRRTVFDNANHRFRAQYGRSGGEDGDFFRRVSENGSKFVWCAEAVVHEVVTRERWLASYYLKRSGRIGGLNGERARADPARMVRRLPLNLIWIALLLPASAFALLSKKHLKVKVLMKLVYELGWLLGLFGYVFFRIRED